MEGTWEDTPCDLVVGSLVVGVIREVGVCEGDNDGFEDDIRDLDGRSSVDGGGCSCCCRRSSWLSHAQTAVVAAKNRHRSSQPLQQKGSAAHTVSSQA